MQLSLKAAKAALKPLEQRRPAPSQLPIVAGRQFITSKYEEVFCTKNLSTLQSQERDFMACLLQAPHRVINMKLGGMRIMEPDVAFLIEVGNLQVGWPCASYSARSNPRPPRQGRPPRTPHRCRNRCRARVDFRLRNWPSRPTPKKTRNDSVR